MGAKFKCLGCDEVFAADAFDACVCDDGDLIVNCPDGCTVLWRPLHHTIAEVELVPEKEEATT